MAFLNTPNRRSVAGTCSRVYRRGKSNVWDKPVNILVAEGERKVRRGSWEKRIGSLARFQPRASIRFFFVCVFFAFQSTLGIGDWVGGKTQSNLLAHMHTHRPLRLDRPEMCTHTLPFWLEELQDSSHFIRAPCCRRVCRHLSVCGSMRVTVCLLIFEYVLMLIRLCVCVCVCTQRGCEWGWLRPGLPALAVRHWSPPEWSCSPTTGQAALQTASLIPLNITKRPSRGASALPQYRL